MWHFTAPLWQLWKVFFLVAQGKAEGAGTDYLGVGSMILEAGAYVLEGDLSPLGKVFASGPSLCH